ncbi:MAG: cation diffusion facilitator family transporter [Methylotenera sp.]|uniref:cation diffusion facilitator family transporter n=1 Tax=Methylotenera sp. TaxID=2051956 RepID=UPI002487403C|nr:cation diffusion facilitator family transporter [Methylotenera sp.]MDI1310080.1 cation diffusion facilitator family transporter [Methylotenera sp.]
MSANCCSPTEPKQGNGHDGRYRKILWIALIVNFSMFVVEIVSGVKANSVSLLADSLDFLGDAANYGISLWVLGMAITIRAKASLIKAISMAAFGVWVLVSAVWHFINGVVPSAETMGIIGVVALIANLAVAALLYAYREGDSNMRGVWLCTRNDAIGNVAVILAAIGVFGTGAAWPDLLVAIIMASLALQSAGSVIMHARTELSG